MFKRYIFIILSLVIAFSCKKYPEDQGRPFETATHRLIKFGWVLKEYNVDGVDSSNHIYDLNSNNTYFLYASIVKFSKSGSLLFHTKPLEARIGGISFNNSKWKFEERKNQMEFSPKGSIGNYFPVEPGIWTIKKLTDTELILETTNVQSKHIRVKYTH